MIVFGAAMVALVFGYAGPAGGPSPTVAILLAAGFAAIAAVASISRMLGFVRRPRPSRTPAAALPKAVSEGVTVRSPP